MENSGLCLVGFLLFGVSALLPWNAFITANEYFMWKLRDVTNGTRLNVTNSTEFSPLQELFENLFAIFGSTVNLAGVLLNMTLTYRVSSFVRMFVGHFLAAAGLIVTAILTHIPTDDWQTDFFVLTMILLILATIGSSFIQGSASGLAAQHSTSHSMKFFMTGQSVVGVLVSVADLVTLAVGESIETAGVMYFGFSAALVLVSLALFFYLSRQTAQLTAIKRHSSDSSLADDIDNIDEQQSLVSNSETGVKLVPTQNSCSWNVFKSTFPYGLCVMLTFAITLTCFPAVVSKVGTSHTGSNWAKYFTAAAVFLTFNIGDLLGRMTTFLFTWPKFSKRPWELLALSLLRIGFIPLLVYCNVQPRRYSNPIFTQDYEFMLILLCFAWSNGYLVNVAVAHLPRTVEQSDTELAGTLTCVYCLSGIATGPLLSLLLWKII